MRSVNQLHDCPNCGADLRHEGDLAYCRFCGTQLAMPGRAVSRSELEAERDQLLAREEEKKAQIKLERRRGIGDFVVPPVGCCGIYFGLFVVGSLILGAIGVEAQKKYGTAVAAIAIGAALVGVVFIIWRREQQRTERIVALEREWSTDRGLREKRLREIETELELLGE